MLIEATQKPIRYRLQTGEELYLKPGVPMEMPELAARQLIKKAGDKVRIVPPTFQAGSHITWTRGDGSVQSGVVDLIHVNDIGIRWAFVTLPGGGWSVVNIKFVKGAQA